jgi:hypothetical protein
MPRSISVRANYKVTLPEPYGEQNGPVTLTISDEAYAKIPSTNFHASDGTKPLIDNGAVGTTNDTVVVQAAVVAAPAALTSSQEATANATDLATAQALANSLKTKYNALQADVAALRTVVANTLTNLKTPGGPMASS